MGKNRTVLVVAAHGDDEVLGLGATIAWHTAQGDQVHLVIMADGVSSRYFDHLKGKVTHLQAVRSGIKRRIKETLHAALILGIKRERVHFFNLADQRLDTYPLLSLIKRIEQIKLKVQPDIVYTHFYGDLNIDHRLTCEAVLTAFRPIVPQTPVEIFLFEVPESTSLSVKRGVIFRPNHLKSVGKYIDHKLNALQAYKSEGREYPHPRSIKFIKKIVQERFLRVQ